MTAPLLSLDGITAGYRTTPVIRDFRLSLAEGESLALLGANGAGKTTLMKVMVGLLRPWSGRVLLRGSDITEVAAEERPLLGVALAPEGRGIFGTLSIEENLLMGALAVRRKEGRRASRALVAEGLEQVYETFPVLGKRRDDKGCHLSGGQQQMLAIGRALMARPALLLLDEPCLGLAPKVAGELYEALGRLSTAERGVVVVEESSRRALGFADRACVVKLGRKVLDCPAAEAGDDEAIMSAYFGVETEVRS
ncbi:branched-chain amino acid transport system ATP-binding protein [Kribbella amoyensis]|uniref:Branched-chain amino acid transport system ATP-binding protein n=1 Tax=Kribbella amoyensis TaxID=996641 RepID=A0A561B8S8_9ACTN|nr:ABC transporter ATP-binding protein [Kribbella amoyensis]TWD75092.1 branched-chain amino acid transport system ATP-binding protein [Kribbella amoyensis]